MGSRLRKTMQVQEVKHIVSTARDLLVGKVPLPVDQCQEITRALIYKFLSAEDAASVSLGGAPRYFTGDRAECRWDALMSPEQTANEVDRRYRDGMALLGRADVMPAIRTIYRDAYIPYNDPIILRDFLRAIDRFDTDDTEKIGDAYEMLLQDLGAQASAGQFRTPRHVIDFIVAVIDPQKHETILDPACGTGGFLASAWEHVNRAGRLSAADRGNLARNLAGYDISPTMAMLSTVNLFLHHQQQPVVSVYDTLTSEERWNDHYDVILANPPFMSPKGGIRPHGRFFSNSRRSEVLFVDYIMGHLNDGGRAGVIVPEGVIFQSQRAHTQLRRLLVETALVAVVSLPAGVFQPYSGVKTSILILDKTLSRRADGIAFFKVENDGYDLGAQRRLIDRNDLPTVEAELREYLRRLSAGESVDDFTPQTGLVVAKERIADGGDYNLSGERYRENGPVSARWPLVQLKDCCQSILSGGTPSTAREDYWVGDIPWITSADIMDIKTAVPRKFITEKAIEESATNLIEKGNIIVVTRVGLGKIFTNDFDVCISQDSQGLIVKEGIDANYLVWVLRNKVQEFKSMSQGSTIQGVTKRQLSELQIPLPPLEMQREIVAEIEGYQRVIDGARAVVDNWRPRIAVDPEWQLTDIGEVAFFQEGPGIRSYEYLDGGYPIINVRCVRDGYVDLSDSRSVDPEIVKQKWSHFRVEAGDILFTTSGTIGRVAIVGPEHLPLLMNTSVVRFRTLNDSILSNEFLYQCLRSDSFVDGLKAQATGSAQLNCGPSHIKMMQIPLPPLATQQAIVAEIEAEQALVSANRELAQRMEARIAAAIGRVWGDS
ncbi:MAG: N-6 DNA methylase [Chloroflexi bacterium]|nr:N-6 DNA methylase [Chloroflexota bacterium]